MRYIKFKNLIMTVAALVISVLCSTAAMADMNLEACAPVSGISIAINNYYARTMHPEQGMAESVKLVSDKVIVETEEPGEKDDNIKTAVERLVEEVETEPEVIITTDGHTFGTVYGTATLRLRKEASADSKTLSLLAEGESYVVLGQEGDFLRIQVDDDLFGYVFKDYIKVTIKTTEELEREKEEREAEAERLRKEAEEAFRKLEEERMKESEAAREQEETTVPEVQVETEPETVEVLTETETSEEPATIEVANNGGDSLPPTSEAETTKAGEPEAETTKAVASEGELQPGNTKGPGGGESISTGGPGSVSSAERAAIVAYAKQFLGGRYVYGGTDLTGGGGVDCSGFTMRVYEYFGYNIGRTSRDQAANGRKISESEAKPGDLFFYASGDTINHVTMYIGNGEVIHASNSTNGIIISNAHYRTPCKVCTFLK